ncbi:hypothetical protein M408DRAFT_334125 [Serendipita vermifera MAFF 305830]|uniref:Amidohydrolase-related domain-containing protein n=1 Tax=Serendipita vermifera MAFF 305830 TaxID=933852 RepID=A0A0C3AJC1_SERVB|nr:hypothetical protein M408DRAFT_334125 [Serendipita vermifera MAFF 305830]
MTQTTNIKINTSRIITVNPESGILEDLDDYTIHVSKLSGRILALTKTTKEDIKADSIDLRGKTVLPGFIDTHVHFFLHPYKETSWEDQVTRESTVERTVRAVTHAKATLLAGYTTVRDLGTEGAEDADVALRKCISHPANIVPGPRYLCASRAIVTTGSYGPKNNSRPYVTEVDGKSGADPASGVDECVRVVRRHIGAGADWIKVYADYPARALSLETRASRISLPLFTSDEVSAMVRTAHSLGVRVASHCVNPRTIEMLVKAGVDTLEHGTGMTEELLSLLKEHRVAWTPTLAAYYSHQYPGSRPWNSVGAVLKKAVQMGVPIATGGDTGVFPHGENSLELKLMHRLGIPWRDILRSATWTSWLTVRGSYWETDNGQEELASFGRTSEDASLWVDRRMEDNDVPVGCIAPGFAADIIATGEDLAQRFEKAVDAAAIEFVMKGGVVYKRDGLSCC